MAKPLVSDELWAIVRPSIPTVERRYLIPGRKRIDDRKVFYGDPVRVEDGTPVGVSAAGDGLRARA